MTTYRRYIIKAVMRTRRHVNRLCREECNRWEHSMSVWPLPPRSLLLKQIRLHRYSN